MPALASQSRRHGGQGNTGPGGGYNDRGGGYDSGAYYDSDAGPRQAAARGGAGHGGRHDHNTAAYFPDGSGYNRQHPSAGDYDAGAAYGGHTQEQMQGADLGSGGAGGLSGIRDPYDKPTRNQLAGAQSRLRQDKRSGALMEVAGRYRTLFAGHHIVRKGLRRSIGDAYAAYVGQVVNLPEDTYALALKALDATFSAKQQTNCAVDFNLWTSPFATSRAKHAQVFNTAKKIMRDLEGYVYDVSYYCPRQLDELRETRRRGGARTPGGESYKEGAALQTAEPPLHKEAVPVARRAAPGGAGGTAAGTAAGAQDATQPRVNPITGAIRRPYDPQDSGQQQYKSPSPTRPRTAPSAGATQPRDAAGRGGAGSGADDRSDAARRRGAAGAARNVSAALDAAAAGDEERDAQRPSGMPPGPRRLGFMGEQRLRGIRRLSSPGMYVKTPPHYKISNYYTHVSPTDDVLDFMHKRLLRQAEMRKLVQQDKVAAAAEAGVDFGKTPEEAAAAAAAAVDEAAAQQQEQLAVMEKILKLGTRHAGPVPRGGKGAFQMGGGPGMGRSSARAGAGRDGNDAPVLVTTFNQPPAPDPAAVAAAAAAQRYAAGGDPATGEPPSETDRIMWIIETAYELGLAGVLGLEGPPQYPRSRRLSPVKYRRQYYDALYGNDSNSRGGSPERYRRSDPGGGAAAAAAAGAAVGAVPPATPDMGAPQPPRAASPSPQTPQTAAAAAAYPHERPPQHAGGALQPAAAGVQAGGNPYGYAYPPPPEPRRPPPPGYYSHVPVPPDWQGPTAYSVEVAAARRRVQDAYPDPPAQWYPRSRRLSP